MRGVVGLRADLDRLIEGEVETLYVDGKLEEPWDYYDHYARTDRPC